LHHAIGKNGFPCRCLIYNFLNSPKKGTIVEKENSPACGKGL
jgi:hypothetical protein